MSGAPIDGREPCERLDWDSRFFGFSVARVVGDVLTLPEVRSVDAWCRSRGIACLYFLARADDRTTARLAEDNGFRLVDVRVTFERTLGDEDASRLAASDLRAATAHDLPHLRPIARVSYRDTRFHYDENIPAERSDALYETWIEASVGGFADAVLVVDVDGTPAGYVTCHARPGSSEGSIGLVGVAASGRGRGLGRRLVMGALGWFAAQGLPRATVATQGRNIAAQRLYQQCGFATRSMGLYFHKWYAPEGRPWETLSSHE